MNPEVSYWPNGQKERESWIGDGKLHRVDGPAFIGYRETGQKHWEDWYADGKKHRLDGPAFTEYYPNGQKKIEIWWVDSKYHRIDGPAWISYHANGQKRQEDWYVDSKKLPDLRPIIKSRSIEEALEYIKKYPRAAALVANCCDWLPEKLRNNLIAAASIL